VVTRGVPASGNSVRAGMSAMVMRSSRGSERFQVAPSLRRYQADQVRRVLAIRPISTAQAVPRGMWTV
jgi:hypothetical protein